METAKEQAPTPSGKAKAFLKSKEFIVPAVSRTAQAVVVAVLMWPLLMAGSPDNSTEAVLWAGVQAAALGAGMAALHWALSPQRMVTYLAVLMAVVALPRVLDILAGLVASLAWW